MPLISFNAWKVLPVPGMVLCCAAITGVLSGETVPEKEDFRVTSIVPEEINGWKHEALKRYTKEDLHKYINGAAELYISRGFKEAFVYSYQKDGVPGITLDIFDMQSAENACGVFAHEAENPGTEIGQGSEHSGGLLVFWKGRYYVSILVYPESEESVRTVMELGRRLADSMPGPGPAKN